jgi:hypothetical protein
MDLAYAEFKLPCRRLPMNQFEFVDSANIKRYQNLLETSVDEAERRTIKNFLPRNNREATQD